MHWRVLPPQPAEARGSSDFRLTELRIQYVDLSGAAVENDFRDDKASSAEKNQVAASEPATPRIR